MEEYINILLKFISKMDVAFQLPKRIQSTELFWKCSFLHFYFHFSIQNILIPQNVPKKNELVELFMHKRVVLLPSFPFIPINLFLSPPFNKFSIASKFGIERNINFICLGIYQIWEHHFILIFSNQPF
jgi:hypothetical protein